MTNKHEQKVFDGAGRNFDGIIRIAKKQAEDKKGLFPKAEEAISDANKRNFLKALGALGVGAFLYTLFSKKSSAAGLIFGSSQRAPDPIGIKDADGTLINPATKEGQYPAGDSSNGTVDLTLANTWYAVPASAPTADYVLAVSLENASGTVRFGLSNSGTPSVTNGNQAPTHLSLKLGANKSVYFASSNAGDDVNYTLIKTS